MPTLYLRDGTVEMNPVGERPDEAPYVFPRSPHYGLPLRALVDLQHAVVVEEFDHKTNRKLGEAVDVTGPQ